MRWFLAAAALILTVGIAASVLAARTSAPGRLDVVEANRVVRAIEAAWPAATTGDLPHSPLAYEVLTSKDDRLAYLAARDTLVDVIVGGEVVGAVAFLNDDADRVAAATRRSTAVLVATGVLLALVACGFALHQTRTIVRPFRELEGFAARVAQGDLDLPLPMDKQHRFGAFTESFDLMREQLATARAAERAAEVSKKELVASLSHDVLTPVASIKVIAELHEAKHGPSPEMTTILGKADQIQLLVTNLFSATLADLQRLRVEVADVTSPQIEAMLADADYLGKLTSVRVPDCVVRADPLRLRQVIDNLLGNSYKYADTPIDLSAAFDDDRHLVLRLCDHGPGVADGELGLLTSKYFRGAGAAGHPGSGLGLYLSAHFLREMGGSLGFESPPGFTAIVRLAL